MKKYIVLLILICSAFVVNAQKEGSISGVVKDKNTQELLPGVFITFKGNDTLHTTTDINGRFTLKLPVGRYNLTTRFIGYSSYTEYNINVSSGNTKVMKIDLVSSAKELGAIEVNGIKTVRATNMITPLSTQRLTTEEILENPGGNFDVSKVIQTLPGVAGGFSANRNDILVRGGGPSENVYYLDGIEIPVLNHFQTQGASGGATGIVNVSFINDVQLTSSAFNSKYSNALSSTIAIKERDGNPNKLSGNLRLSGSEFAATLEGPIGKKTTFLASARRSYLKFLFQLLDLPIRPDYWDFQYKIKHRFDKKTTLTLIGIGAIDNFKLAAPKTASPTNAYIIRSNPLIKQWNYTVGASLKRRIKNGFLTFILSRDMFHNGAERYENNATKSGKKLYSLQSYQAENKFRFNVNKYINGWKFSYGIGMQYVKYHENVENTVKKAVKDSTGQIVSPEVVFSSHSNIGFYKFGFFGQVAKYFFHKRLLLSGGVRSDMNTYMEEGLNPLKTISPRFSLSYNLTEKWSISASVGSYFKIPVYTTLGYKDKKGDYVNKNLKYINAIHYTIGTEFVPRNDFRFTVEAFYKDYKHYPVSLNSGISLANLGTGFSAVGSDNFTSIGNGRAYGVEAYVQQKLAKRLFYVASATLYKSEFSGQNGVFRPSTWDYGFIVSATFGYHFKKDWTIGVKYRIAGGQPYTPYDIEASTKSYLTKGKGVYDYSQLNEKRLPLFRQLDLRVDKKFNFKKTSLDVYLDFQNVLLHKTPVTPYFTFQRNKENTGFITTDDNPIKSDGSNAKPIVLKQGRATIVPAIGFIFTF